MKYIKRISLLAAILTGSLLQASNLQITTVPILTKDIPGNQIKVSFDMNWEYSWNLAKPGNWDAAWVFMKYKIEEGMWEQAYLIPEIAISQVIGAGSSPSAADLLIKYGTSPTYNTVNDEYLGEKTVGMFVYRKNEGHGPMDLKNVTLIWDITDLGLSNNNVISVKVFGIEMVYVPDGAFSIGDEMSYDRFTKVGDRLNAIATSVKPNFGGNAPGMVDLTPYGLISQWTDVSATNSNYTYQYNNPASPLNGTLIHTLKEYAHNAGYWLPNAFDSTATVMTSHWHTNNANEWVEVTIQYPSAQKITWFEIHANNSSTNYTIDGMYLQGSNDGINWRPIYGNEAYLDPRNTYYNPGSLSYMLSQTINTFTVDLPDNYTYYKFGFHKPVYCVIYEMRLFGGSASTINQVTSENTLYYAGDSLGPDFPKGTKAFYVMKHELSQSAWVEFLNTLTYDQQREHFSADIKTAALATVHYSTASRQRVRLKAQALDRPAVFGISATGSYTTELGWDAETNGGNIPMFSMCWTDVLAYLDWACLRPITELEYEKMCRGPVASVRYEHAWGSPYTMSRVVDVVNKDQPSESPMPEEANNVTNNNANNTGFDANAQKYWPVRCGSLARETTTREEAGATYWGILNAADNVPERYINIFDLVGRQYKGTHGDGKITTIGKANNPDWPNCKSPTNVGTANTAAGSGYKGIPVINTTIQALIMPVSCRWSAGDGNTKLNNRDAFSGCRGGRTAE